MNKDLIFGSLSRPSKKGGGKFFFLKNEVNLVYLGIDYKLAFYFLASMYSFCGARPRNNGLFPNSGPSEERPVQRETTYEALLNPNKRQGSLSEE